MIANFLLYFWEFINRPDFAGLYLGLVGLTCFWFGFRSLALGEAVTFGLHGKAVTGREAARVGGGWLAIGSAVMFPALLLVLGIVP